MPRGIARTVTAISQSIHKVSRARLRSKALHFTTRKQWREWLSRNHALKDEVLLVIYKREPKTGTFSNLDAIEEALCFGWIDGCLDLSISNARSNDILRDAKDL